MNILRVLASKTDLSINIPPDYSIKYIPYTNLFQGAITYLATEISTALDDARINLNRVDVGMARVPELLKTIILLVEEASYTMLMTEFPESFNTVEQLVNESLTVLRKPEQSFKQVLNILTELEFLTNAPHTSDQQILSLQIADLKSQWMLLAELMTELSKLAETTREYFLLQFNWVLKEFIRSGPNFPDILREFIISLIKPKVIEIDRASDILGTITKSYSDASSQITDEYINGNGHLLGLTNDVDRQRYINQFRHDLPMQAVQIARLALKQHKEFLQKDKYRQAGYENIIAAALKASSTNKTTTTSK